MEEKKLTDEEIVKALECCAVEPCEDCGNCPRFTKEKLCHKANAKQSLDLIHRLQSENEKLKPKKILANRVYSDATLKGWKKEDLIEQIRILEHNWAAAEEALNNSSKNAEKLLAEQKAEIERLTKKAEEAKFWENEYLEWATGFLKTRFEIKDWFTNPEKQSPPCTYEFFASTLWEKIRPSMEWLDELKERNEKLHRENIELQKQVDKCFMEVGKMCAEAEKDTAKEILQKIMNIIKKSNGFLAEEVVRIMAKQNGVEVE